MGGTTRRVKAMGPVARRILTLPAFDALGTGALSVRQVRGYLVAVLAFAIAFAVRYGLDAELPPGIPFITFFPAVIFSTFVFGIWPGTLCAILSAAASWQFFLKPPADGSLLPMVLALGFFLLIVTIDILLIHMMHTALSRLDQLQSETNRLADERALYVDELDHRIKNILANVTSIVALAARHASDPRQLEADVRSRIEALSSISSLLRGREATSATPLADLVEMILEPVAGGCNTRVDRRGLDATVDHSKATALSLVLHELATNAVKHGALSVKTGRVTVSGRLDRVTGRQSLVWEETGGPPRASAAPGARGGFGSVLLTRVPQSIGGKLDLDYRDSGLVATLQFPLLRVDAPERPQQAEAAPA